MDETQNKTGDSTLDLCLTPGNKLYDFFSVTKRQILKDAGLTIDVIAKMNLDADPEVVRMGEVLYSFMEEWSKTPNEDRSPGALEILNKCKEILLSAKELADKNGGTYPESGNV